MTAPVSQEPDCPVIVVGAGPVGLMLAGELGLAGVPVTVLEQRDEPATETRASTLHARTMEVLDQRGLLSELGSPPAQRMGHFGGIPLDFGLLATRYPGQWKVPQAALEALLADWAQCLGVTVRRGHRVVDVDLSDDRATVRVQSPDGPLELGCRYLVGCDGEQSTIRQLAGIPLKGKMASRELFRADVAGLDIPQRRFNRLPGGLAIAGAIAPGLTRIMVSEFVASANCEGAATYAEVCDAWRRVTGEDISNGTPVWVNRFNNASQLATSYRRGPVLLAGDAAHLQMPSGGQAINFGLQDAVNLGWKLAAAATGRAPAGLLDTYHDERHAVGRQVLRDIEAQSALLLGDPDIEPLRLVLAELIGRPQVRDLLAGQISGLEVRYDGGASPLTGHRLADLELLITGRPATSTELLRSGRALLLDFGADRGRRAVLARAAATSALPVKFVAAKLPDGTSTISGAEIVLVRPDGYVAWAGSDVAEAGVALARWFGRSTRT